MVQAVWPKGAGKGEKPERACPARSFVAWRWPMLGTGPAAKASSALFTTSATASRCARLSRPASSDSCQAKPVLNLNLTLQLNITLNATPGSAARQLRLLPGKTGADP